MTGQHDNLQQECLVGAMHASPRGRTTDTRAMRASLLQSSADMVMPYTERLRYFCVRPVSRVRSSRLVDQESGKIAEEAEKRVLSIGKLGYGFQGRGHVNHPRISFVYAD